MAHRLRRGGAAVTRLVPLNMRLADEAISLDALEILLIIIDHPLMDEPLRLASSWTVRLQNKPVTYGVRSTWRTGDGKPFLFVLINAIVPDEVGDAPAAANLMIEVFDDETGPMLLSTTEPATVHMALVLASDPDTPEREWLDLELVGSEIADGDMTLDLSKEPRTDEPFPWRRFSRHGYPGQHR